MNHLWTGNQEPWILNFGSELSKFQGAINLIEERAYDTNVRAKAQLEPVFPSPLCSPTDLSLHICKINQWPMLSLSALLALKRYHYKHLTSKNIYKWISAYFFFLKIDLKLVHKVGSWEKQTMREGSSSSLNLPSQRQISY